MKAKTRNIIIGVVIGLILTVIIVGILIFTSKSSNNPTPTDQCNEIGMLCGNGRVCNPNKICSNCSTDEDCNKKQSGYICSEGRCTNRAYKTRQEVIDEFGLTCADLTNSTNTNEKVNICFIDENKTLPVNSISGNITGMKCYSSDSSDISNYSKSLGREIDDMAINNPPGAVSQNGEVFYPANDNSVVWMKQTDTPNVVCPVLDSISFLHNNNFYFYSSPTDKPLIKDMSKLNPKTISASNSGIVSSLWNVIVDPESPSVNDVQFYTNLNIPDSYKKLYGDAINSSVDANYERVCISPRDGMCQLFTTSPITVSSSLLTYNPNNKPPKLMLTGIYADSDNAPIGKVFNCCMSYDGTYQAIDTVKGIYLSSDKGSSYEDNSSSFHHITFNGSDSAEKYIGISMSYDGKVIYTQRGSSYYYSNNYGKDFNKVASIPGMSNFALTHDGIIIYTVCNDSKTAQLYAYRAISSREDKSVGDTPNFKPIAYVIPDKSAFTGGTSNDVRIKCSPSGKIIVVSGTVNGKVVTYVSINGNDDSPTFSLLS